MACDRPWSIFVPLAANRPQIRENRRAISAGATMLRATIRELAQVNCRLCAYHYLIAISEVMLEVNYLRTERHVPVDPLQQQL